MKRYWRLPSAVVIVGLLVLSGCSKSGDTAGSGGAEPAAGSSAGSEAGQVVARVNGEEITIHQLNLALAAVQSDRKDADKVRRQVLRGIVYRTALRQAATKEGLDRNPEVALQIDAAKDRILAAAYLRQQTDSTPPPTTTDIEKFISDNPLEFGQRRVYQFSRLTLAADQYSDDLVPLFDQKQTFDGFEKYLNQKHIPYAVTDVRLPSAEFPKDIRDQLTKFGVGDNIVVKGGGQIAVLKIKSWVDMPVDHDQATQIAKNTLHREALADRTKSLHDQVLHAAKVQFLGQFAGVSLEPPPAAATAAGGPAAAIDSPVAGAPGGQPDQTGPGTPGQTSANSPQGGQSQ
jgi:peptidyl-prolyl cis-trans isomerase C